MDNRTSKTLLFAEDEPELLEIYTHWFQKLGYNVLGASNGNEALAICRTHPVDLVISDVRMAGGDGIMLARELKATMDASPLLVFLTGFADLSNEEAYDLGACSILSKPIGRDKLRQAVERFLKPPRELWSAPLTIRLNALLKKRYESLAGALHQRALSLGRGGMFVRDGSSPVEEVPIGFQFRFTEGNATRMGLGLCAGSGRDRSRTCPQAWVSRFFTSTQKLLTQSYSGFRTQNRGLSFQENKKSAAL